MIVFRRKRFVLWCIEKQLSVSYKDVFNPPDWLRHDTTSFTALDSELIKAWSGTTPNTDLTMKINQVNSVFLQEILNTLCGCD